MCAVFAGRRRDKINHWIMKLGSIIPADGTSLEVGGEKDRISVAAVEGQSKGGILSKACEYVQTLQERLIEYEIHYKRAFFISFKSLGSCLI